MAVSRPKFALSGLTYDDVILVPAKSEVLPGEVDTATRVSRHVLELVPARLDLLRGRRAKHLRRRRRLGRCVSRSLHEKQQG